MDAVCAPGTASSMFGGFWYEEMIDMFEVLVKKAKVIGIVLTEVAPPYDDAAGTTTYLAARMLSDLLGFAMRECELNE